MTTPDTPSNRFASFESERPQSLNTCRSRCIGEICALQTHIDSFREVLAVSKSQPDNEALDNLAQATHSALQEACAKYYNATRLSEHVEEHGEPF